MVLPLKKVEADWEIVEGFQRKDEKVQRGFYLRCLSYYRERSGGVLDLHTKAPTREDLFHETFIRLWEELENHTIYVEGHEVYRIDHTGRTRRMTASLLTFFMAIAKNINQEMAREEEGYESLFVDVEDLAPEQEEEEAFLIERVVNECVSRLPSRCRDILTKFYYQCMTLDQILASREENVSKDGLKSGKSKCMKRLKEDLLENFKKYNLKIIGHGQRDAK